MRCVQRRGDRLAAGHDLGAPLGQRNQFTAAFQQQTGFAAARRGAVLVARQLGNLFPGVRRAVAQQAMQQKHVEKTQCRRADADALERVQIHAAHLDVFDAALAQRVQRALAAVDHALRADRSVELVLDLQQARRKLFVVADRIANPDFLVRRVGPGQRVLQRRAVARQAVVADRQVRLRIALVTQAPHAQRRRVRQEHGLVAQRLQFMRAPGDKARRDRGRRTEQIEQQKRMAPEVADQAEVLVARDLGHRPVVVNPRNGLHAPAVTVAQARAVDALRQADVGAAVAADRNGGVGRQAAGHAGDPHHFVAGFAKRLHDELVDLRQLFQTRLDARVHPGDELELRLAEVGGDVRVRERRAERRRVRRQREFTAGLRAQAFFFDAASDRLQALLRQRAQSFVQGAHGAVSLRRFRPRARRSGSPPPPAAIRAGCS